MAREQHLDVPADLGPFLTNRGIEVVRWPFAGRVREVVVDGFIGIDRLASAAWERWLIAHALGHHLMHTGTSLYLESWRWVERNKAERQAEEFAAGLLLPPDPLARPSVSALARACGIPREKAAFALTAWGRSAA